MFYEVLSRYYDIVFPRNPSAEEFVRHRLPMGAAVADAACGTGTMALALAAAGMRCTAVDLEPEMIRQARQKDTQGMVDFRVDNMLNIRNWGSFDAILCLGNSLSHLDTRDELRQFFADSRGTLRNRGRCIYQIVNYDRILAVPEGIDLPTLGNNDVVFQRRYVPTETGGIRFQSRLEADGQSWDHEIALQPIESAVFRRMLEGVGFSVELFGDYSGRPYNKNSSFSLIAVADIG